MLLKSLGSRSYCKSCKRRREEGGGGKNAERGGEEGKQRGEKER